jgi:beta-barrel assembly-enhancing protease
MPATNTQPIVYPAHAFHESLPDGRAAGVLRLLEGGFHFESEAGAVTVPFAGAQLTLGGAGNRLVFVAHPAFAAWSIYTSERDILRDPRLLQCPELAPALGQIRGKRLRNRAWVLAATLILLGVPLLLLLNLGVLTRLAARQVPTEWEMQLGKLAFNQIELNGTLVEDATTNELLSKLTQSLVTALPDNEYEFRFHVARDAQLNAFALPGGYVVVHTELLLRASSAEELLGVLAHEISHVTEQHGTRNLLASAGLALTLQLLIGDAGGIFGTLASAAPFLLTQKYSRGFEREADRRGFELLVRANVDPSGMLSFFEKLKAEEARRLEKLRKQGSTGELMSELPEFLSTHPTTDSRIAALRAMVTAQRSTYRDLDATFAALKTQVLALQRAAPQPSNEADSDEDAD